MIYKLSLGIALSIFLPLFSMEKPAAPFLDAARAGDTPRMRALAAQEIAQCDLSGALFTAIQAQNLTTCRYIINETPVNCNAAKNNYHSPISAAAYHKNATALVLLLERPDLDLKQTTKNGLNILEILARDGYAHLIDKILKNKNHPYTTQECQKALMIAVLNNQEDAAHELLNHKICPNYNYPGNKTPLHRAVEQNRPGMVRLLLQMGALVDPTDNNGATPLFTAVCSNKKRAVAEILIAYGANLEKTLNYAASLHYTQFRHQIKRWFPALYKQTQLAQKRNLR